MAALPALLQLALFPVFIVSGGNSVDVASGFALLSPVPAIIYTLAMRWAFPTYRRSGSLALTAAALWLASSLTGVKFNINRPELHHIGPTILILLPPTIFTTSGIYRIIRSLIHKEKLRGEPARISIFVNSILPFLSTVIIIFCMIIA